MAWDIFNLTYDQTAAIAFQLCHALLANFVVKTGDAHFGHKWMWAAGVVAFGVAKEFWYDYKYEDAQTRGSSLLDFSMYCVGVAIAYLV